MSKELVLIKTMLLEVVSFKDYYLLHSLRRYCEKTDLQTVSKELSENIRNMIKVMILKLDKIDFEIDDSNGSLTFAEKSLKE